MPLPFFQGLAPIICKPVNRQFIIVDPKKKNNLRTLLNALFMLGFVAAVLLYFTIPAPHTVALIVGWTAVVLKIVEFLIRFLVK